MDCYIGFTFCAIIEKVLTTGRQVLLLQPFEAWTAWSGTAVMLSNNSIARDHSCSRAAFETNSSYKLLANAGGLQL